MSKRKQTHVKKNVKVKRDTGNPSYTLKQLTPFLKFSNLSRNDLLTINAILNNNLKLKVDETTILEDAHYGVDIYVEFFKPTLMNHIFYGFENKRLANEFVRLINKL